MREISIDGQVNTSKGGKAGANFSKDVLRYVSHQEIEDEPRSCKICMEETDEGDNFLFNPCKCSGSCGTVHFECLKQWIHVKVRKEVLGGTLHYNFEKFEC